MVREKELFLVRLMKASDAFMIACSFIAAYYISLGIKQQFDLGPLAYGQDVAIPFFLKHTWVVLIVIPSWIGLMSMDGVYEGFRTKIFLETIWRVFRTGLVSIIFLGSSIFLSKMTLTSRLYISVFAFSSLLGLVIEKAIWRRVLDYSFRQGYNLVHILLVGTGKRAQEFIEIVRAHSNWGLEIVGLLDDDPKLLGSKIRDYEVIGRINDIPRIIRDSIVDRVIFVVPRLWLNRIEDAIYYCEREGISTGVSVDLYKPKLAKMSQTNFAGVPLIMYQTSIAKEWQLFFKRILDTIISLIAVLLLLPLLLATALTIRISSKGPILFRQLRCGLNGRKFTMYKFRSMYVGSEIRQRELSRQNEMNGPVFKMKRDPRITPFGKFMRRLSIDELPQLLNVLKGDMSLVGPRPPITTEVEMYESWQRRRLSMKPGLTCVWQVSGRNKIDFEQWMEMDLQYIDNFSLWLDIKLMVRTVFVVLTGYGAA